MYLGISQSVKSTVKTSMNSWKMKSRHYKTIQSGLINSKHTDEILAEEIDEMLRETGYSQSMIHTFDPESQV